MQNSKKEEFLNLLRDMNVYVKEDFIKEKKRKEVIKEEETEEIIPHKKIFKHENPLNKLKEVHYGRT